MRGTRGPNRRDLYYAGKPGGRRILGVGPENKKNPRTGSPGVLWLTQPNRKTMKHVVIIPQRWL